MKRLFLDIPHINPKLEIICYDENLMEYLCHAFAPYTSGIVPVKGQYKRLYFYKNKFDKVVVADNECKECIQGSVLACLQKYLLRECFADNGYLMLHGGSVAFNDCAFIFLANSMVGKSTLMTHLCMSGFEYVTDDRVLIDVNELKIIPFAKTIMLRSDGKKLLEKRYGHQISTVPFVHESVQREFYEPEIIRGYKTKLSCIYILDRKEDCKLERVVLNGKERIVELMKYCLSIQDCKKIHEFIRLSNISVEKIVYSDLNQIIELIKGQCVFENRIQK